MDFIGMQLETEFKVYLGLIRKNSMRNEASG